MHHVKNSATLGVGIDGTVKVDFGKVMTSETGQQFNTIVYSYAGNTTATSTTTGSNFAE